LASLILVVNVVGELQQKRTLAASRGFLAAARLSCYLCHGPMLCISCFCSIFRQTSRFGTLHSRPKQCKHVLDFSWHPSWNLLEISSKFV